MLPEFGDWRRISPFAIAFFFGATIRSIVGNVINLATSFGVFAVLFSSFDFLSSGSSRVLAVLLALVGIGIRSLVRYWFFRFRLEEDRILIRQGFFKRTALDLPFDRVQAIHVERSLMQRLFGLVTVRIETSGSSGSEGLLPTISVELADWLRERVERDRRSHSPDAAANLVSSVSTDPEGSTSRTLLRLKNGDMVRIGLADYRIFLLAAVFGGLVNESWWESAGVSIASMLVGRGFGVLVAAIIGFVFLVAIVFTLASLAGAFLRYHDFTLWRTGTALHARGGLFTQKEVVVEVARVQRLALSQNLVMRWLRRVKLSAFTAGAGATPDGNVSSQAELAANLHVPLLNGAMTEALRREVFGDEAKELSLRPANPGFVRVSPWYIRAVFLRIALIPLAVLTCVLVIASLVYSFPDRGISVTRIAAALIVWGQVLSPWYLGWFFVSFLIAWQRWRRRAVLCVDAGLAARRGLIGYRVDAFLFRKVQSVQAKQSPFQRRKQLATLEIQLASGTVTVPYIKYRTACRLRDYMLWTVESGRRRWY